MLTIVVQPLTAANALDNIDTNFGDAQKLASEWQHSILTSNTLITKLFNKTTNSTLPAASRSLLLNSAATSSSPGSNQTSHVISTTCPLIPLADSNVTDSALMSLNCNLAQCKFQQDVDLYEDAVVLGFARYQWVSKNLIVRPSLL